LYILENRKRYTFERLEREGGVNMSENKTTYESLDGKIAPEALLKAQEGNFRW